jgi:hypothetical protein
MHTCPDHAHQPDILDRFRSHTKRDNLKEVVITLDPALEHLTDAIKDQSEPPVLPNVVDLEVIDPGSTSLINQLYHKSVSANT